MLDILDRLRTASPERDSFFLLCDEAAGEIEKLRGNAGWQPIETHPRDARDCVLAIFHASGLWVADRGGWVPTEQHDEYDETEEGIRIKIGTSFLEGHWWSNHELIEEPTHWMPLPAGD